MTALIVHVFYPELWQEIASCIRNFQSEETDIFITCSVDQPAVIEKCQYDFPNASVTQIENRGYDIGPFLTILSKLDLNQYEFVVKLHTKRNVDEFVNYWYLHGGAWRRELLSFCSTSEAAESTIHRLRENPRAGMAGSGRLILDAWTDPAFSTMKENGEKELQKMGFGVSAERCWRFVAGSMFIVKAPLLKPLLNIRLHSDFSPTQREDGMTLAHIYERLFGCIIAAQGFEVVSWTRGHIVSALLSIIYRMYCRIKIKR